MEEKVPPMSSVAIDYTYSYPFASEVCADQEKPLVRLSTYDDRGSPHFFNSGIAEPAVFADALICISTIVRSHFFERKIGLLDPVVTCGQSRLRFEGFSGCCGVYLQCNFDDSAFTSPIQGRGTTNIDFNEQFVQGLAQTRFADSVQLSVGANDVTLGVGGRVIKEKKVKLPLRWLKGFCEVQSYLTDAELMFTIPAVEVLRFIRGLPRSAGRSQTLWLTAAGNTLRLTTKTGKGTVPVVGTERLRAIEPLVRISKKPVEIWHARGVTTWKIALTGCTFVATFSPEIYRGFSGEGQTLQSLATGDWKNALDQVRSKLHWQGTIDSTEIAERANLPVAEVQSALDALATRGLVGFDISDQSFFHRELPFNSDLIEDLHPRLQSAQKLIANSAIRQHQSISATDSEWLVQGSGVEHMVRLSESGDRCTCTWYSKHQNSRGPCKHILAARILAFGDND